MRVFLSFRTGPAVWRSENLLRRPGRRRNAWTWLALFPLLWMWTVARWMVLFYVLLGLWTWRGAVAAWRAARR